MDLQVVFGLSYGFSPQRERRRELSPIMCKEAPLSTMFSLYFDFMIDFGLDVFASSIVDYGFEENCIVHVCVSQYYSLEFMLPFDLLGNGDCRGQVNCWCESRVCGTVLSMT